MLSPPLLLALLVVAILATLFLRQRQASGGATGNVLPLTGTETGTFETYLARIEALARTGADSFFVTAAEAAGPRFIQVSAERDASGGLAFQFDMPILDWSAPYADRIEAEAKKRGLRPRRTAADPMAFLDIDFATSGDHAVFARWVVTRVFGLSGDARFEVTWG